MSETHTLWVPGIFWDDHMGRECLPAIAERRSGNVVEVTLTYEALEDLESDADLYADMIGEEWAREPHGRSICQSAHRTKAAIAAYRTQRT